MTVQATAEGKNRAKEITLLSSLQPEECVEQLLTLGVAIPQELNGINIQKVVAAFESDPDLHLVVNYTVASDFLKAVRHAVNLYHGWTDEHGSASLTRYTLQYSTLHSWNPSTMNLTHTVGKNESVCFCSRSTRSRQPSGCSHSMRVPLHSLWAGWTLLR